MLKDTHTQHTIHVVMNKKKNKNCGEATEEVNTTSYLSLMLLVLSS